MTTEEILSKLNNVKEVGTNQWCANCPSCNDTKRHLYISSNNNITLFDCKKGCSWIDVISAIGLEKRDIYLNKHKKESWEILRTHEYLSKDKNKLGLKTIYQKSDGSKTALWQHYEGNTLVRGLNGLKMPLYHVYNLDKSKPVIIVEGEKDVETLEKMGYIATTSPNGAGSHWRKDFNPIFKDFDVLILADNDEIGLKYATEVANNLINVAKTVKLVSSKVLYENLKDKGDISDIVVEIGLERTSRLLQNILNSNDYIYFSHKTILNNNNIPEWQKQLNKSNTGVTLPTLHNIITILNNDDMYKNKIEYNELIQMRTLEKNNWTDIYESRLKLFLEEKYTLFASLENINHVCNIIADEHSYHPIKSYFESIHWDGINRIYTVFSDYLGADNNIYTQSVAIITFVGAVARIYVPGIKYDTCTVFVGKQGIGKSKFIQKLAVNPDWFTDGVTTFDGKDFYESIQGKWIIELGEGTAFQKSMKERTKQAIASQQDFYRKPYGRNPEIRKRQCIFLGTTNNYDFLKDETGDRRYYPIDVNIEFATKSIDKDLNDDYIAQLWAEAVHLYKQGQSIYIQDKNILKVAEEEQRKHFDESPLQADIYNFLEILLPTPQEWYSMELESRRRYIKAVQQGDDTFKSLGYIGKYKRDRVSVKEIMCELFGYELNQPIERKLSLEVSKSLISLGWNKSSKVERIIPYGVNKIYYK